VHADEIYVLQNGIITEHGTHNELLAANGEYQKFYTIQYFT
jgi:ABC-type transport system involved in Fe-S cluster assembly fused permease/ATPase subunit